MVTIFEKPGGGLVFMIWATAVLISIADVLIEISLGWVGDLAVIVTIAGFVITLLALFEPLL
jgi:hypothetical protein